MKAKGAWKQGERGSRCRAPGSAIFVSRFPEVSVLSLTMLAAWMLAAGIVQGQNMPPADPPAAVELYYGVKKRPATTEAAPAVSAPPVQMARPVPSAPQAPAVPPLPTSWKTEPPLPEPPLPMQTPVPPPPDTTPPPPAGSAETPRLQTLVPAPPPVRAKEERAPIEDSPKRELPIVKPAPPEAAPKAAVQVAAPQTEAGETRETVISLTPGQLALAAGVVMGGTVLMGLSLGLMLRRSGKARKESSQAKWQPTFAFAQESVILKAPAAVPEGWQPDEPSQTPSAAEAKTTVNVEPAVAASGAERQESELARTAPQPGEEAAAAEKNNSIDVNRELALLAHICDQNLKMRDEMARDQ